LHDDLEDLEIAFPALASEVFEHDPCLRGKLMVVLFDIEVWEASFEVAFQRLLGVVVRDINVHLVCPTLIRGCLRRYDEHGNLLDELEVVGQEIVEAFQIGNLQLKP
tara:strand:- start:445 stop:765 length:321 start_codon:yes stop_codon:yes gene_type:complete